MIKYLKRKLRSIFLYLSYGLRNTENEIFGQKTKISDSNTITQKQQMNELADALLKGEVTQEVEKLRDRTYWVADESKNFKVIIDTVGTSKAIKKTGKKATPLTFNNLEGFEIKMIMDNYPEPTSILKSLDSVNGYGIQNQYPLKFQYEYAPKYGLDEYVRKLVLRTNGEILLLDLYVPKHIDSFERMEKLFDNEINKVKNNKMKPVHLEFKTISFISNNTYGIEDRHNVSFEFIKFLSIAEFDGKNILTYEVKMSDINEKITDKYKNEKLRKSYENKESRNTKLDFTGEKEKHKCDKCGEEVESNYDYRITKETIGIGVCKKCLEKYNKKNETTV